MIDPALEPSPTATGEAADLAHLRDGLSELAIFLQRIAAAIGRSQVGELAHDLSDGASIASERQLPMLLAAVDREAGRLRGLACQHSGRLLAAQDFARADDLARRREAVRPVYAGVDTERGRAIILPGAADGR